MPFHGTGGRNSTQEVFTKWLGQKLERVDPAAGPVRVQLRTCTDAGKQAEFRNAAQVREVVVAPCTVFMDAWLDRNLTGEGVGAPTATYGKIYAATRFDWLQNKITIDESAAAARTLARYGDGRTAHYNRRGGPQQLSLTQRAAAGALTPSDATDDKLREQLATAKNEAHDASERLMEMQQREAGAGLRIAETSAELAAMADDKRQLAAALQTARAATAALPHP